MAEHGGFHPSDRMSDNHFASFPATQYFGGFRGEADIGERFAGPRYEYAL